MDATKLFAATDKTTPAYIFDTDTFAVRARQVRDAFGSKVRLCYSIKANPFLLSEIPPDISYFEVCSPGELSICESSDLDMSRVIYSGVNKGSADVARAINDGVGVLTAESFLHYELIRAESQKQGKVVSVLLRLSDGSQFGMDKSVLEQIIAIRDSCPEIKIIGLHYFTGTQKKKAAVIESELELLRSMLCELKEKFGFVPVLTEYGTGLSVDYFKDKTDDTDIALLGEIAPFIRSFGEDYSLSVEMGRFFAATSGTYYTRVCDIKCNNGYNYAICDGGMNQLKYFGQNMAMQVPPIMLVSRDGTADIDYTLCGSLCTTADVLVRRVTLPKLCIGDVLAFSKCGAYSVSEGISTFLSREMPLVAVYSEEKGIRTVRKLTSTYSLNSPFGNTL